MKVECLNVSACALEQSLDLFPFQQWNQLLLLVMKIIGIVKGLLLFVYIHNKKESLLFCKIRQKNIMQLSASALILCSTIMNKLPLYYTLKQYSKKHWVQNKPIWAG